jgi:hypothetical protein
VLTCEPCPIVDDNSLPIPFVVSACLSDGLIYVMDHPVVSEFA